MQNTEQAASRSDARPRRRSRGAALAAILAPALALGGLAAVTPLPVGDVVDSFAGGAPVAARAADSQVIPGTLTVEGSGRVGTPLRVTTSDWQPEGTTLSYQWERGGEAIPGAIGSIYWVTPEDIGEQLYVLVVGVAPDGAEGHTYGDPAEGLPGQLTPPQFSLTGAALRVGEEYTVATVGDWDPKDGVTPSYKWFYGSEAVTNSNSATHVIRPEGIGKKLSVQVSGLKVGYEIVPYTVNEATGRTIVGQPFVKAPAPTIAKVQQPTGLHFSALSGEWDPAPTTMSYQWLRSGAVIPGAEFEFYRPKAADAGKPISVRVTARRDGYAPTVRTSAPVTGPVSRLTAAPKPKISGTARVGKRLAVNAGSWKPYRVTLSYRWLRNGKAIKGATKSRYKLTAKDRGKRISVRVTGTKPGYATVSKTSSAKRVSRTR